jgi:predicted neuraminidase
MRPTSLANPNSGIEALSLGPRRHLLVYNPTRRGRTPLTIALSEDGLRWRDVTVLEDEPGEYSYPAAVRGVEGDVHVTWTWRRQRIRYARLAACDLG